MMARIAAATSLCRRRSSIGSSRRAQSSSSTGQRIAAPPSSVPTAHIGYSKTISGFMMKRIGYPDKAMFLIVAGCAVAGNGGLKRFQRVENRVWPETLPVIDFDVSEADSAVPGDYICRGYRQLPTRVTVGS